MKITIKKIFIFCLLVSAPIPWIINIGGSQGIYFYEIIAILCFFLMIYKKSFSKAKNRLPKIKYFENLVIAGKLFVLFTLLGLILNFIQNGLSQLFDINTIIKMSVHVLITVLVILGSFTAGFSLFNGKKDLNLVSSVVLFTILITAVPNLYVWITTTGGTFDRYNYEITTSMGVGDTAKLFIIGFLISFFIFLKSKVKINKLFYLFSVLVLGAAILSIQSRAAYVIFFFQIIWLFILLKTILKRKINIIVKLTLSLCGLFILYFIIDTTINSGLLASISENLLVSNSQESLNKLLVIIESFEIFMNNPLFGIGWGQFALHSTTEMMVISNEFSVNYTTVASPHNGLAQLLSETGLFGTISAIAISFYILKLNFYAYKIQNDSMSKIFLGIVLITSFTYIFLQLVASSYLFPPPVQRSSVIVPFIYWFLIGYSFSFFKTFDINNNKI